MPPAPSRGHTTRVVAIPWLKRKINSLSRKCASVADLMVDDQRSGQVEEGEIGVSLLLPTHEQATEAVEPGVGHLHDPPARRMAGGVGWRGQWLRFARLRRNMGNEVMVL